MAESDHELIQSFRNAVFAATVLQPPDTYSRCRKLEVTAGDISVIFRQYNSEADITFFS